MAHHPTFELTSSKQELSALIHQHALPCPFCGSGALSVTEWCGEYPAIECARCHGAAPADKWNMRTSIEEKPE